MASLNFQTILSLKPAGGLGPGLDGEFSIDGKFKHAFSPRKLS